MDKKAALSICFAQEIRGVTFLWPVGRDAAGIARQGCFWKHVLKHFTATKLLHKEILL